MCFWTTLKRHTFKPHKLLNRSNSVYFLTTIFFFYLSPNFIVPFSFFSTLSSHGNTMKETSLCGIMISLIVARVTFKVTPLHLNCGQDIDNSAPPPAPSPHSQPPSLRRPHDTQLCVLPKYNLLPNKPDHKTITCYCGFAYNKTCHDEARRRG